MNVRLIHCLEWKHFLVRPNESIKIPLTELKCILAMAADETLKESFNLTCCFGSYPAFSESLILAVRTTSVVPTCTTTQSQSTFTATLWFKNTIAPVRTGIIDDVKIEDFNLEEIDPGHAAPISLDDDIDDNTLMQAAEHVDSTPYIPSLFIQPTGCHPVAPSSESACTAPQISQEPVPEWDCDIPQTPNSYSASGINLDDLWM